MVGLEARGRGHRRTKADHSAKRSWGQSARGTGHGVSISYLPRPFGLLRVIRAVCSTSKMAAFKEWPELWVGQGLREFQGKVNGVHQVNVHHVNEYSDLAPLLGLGLGPLSQR